MSENTVFETADGGSVSGSMKEAIKGRPYRVTDSLNNGEGQSRGKIPVLQSKDIQINYPSEILLPIEIQAKAKENFFAQIVLYKDQELLNLNRDILLKQRYLMIYEFALKSHINLDLYEIIDDAHSGEVKFRLKEIPK